MPDQLPGRTGVAVVGGGQAGLAMSRCLLDAGVEHVVLERHRLGHESRESRWDSFCLVTPNWQCQLPGFPYRGRQPHGFMVKDEVVAYLESYAASFAPPLHTGVEVLQARPAPAPAPARFAVSTSAGELHADAVVVATGGYHRPIVPTWAGRIPEEVAQIHSSQYRSPERLPPGAVLVVGSGQSGAQIAEDLHLAGRTVHLAVGSAPRCARFYRGRDVVDWLADMGHYDIPVDEHPLGDAVKHKTNHYVTGRDGGRDIDLRAFAAEGMRLHGTLAGLRGARLGFEADLRANLDAADEVYNGINAGIDRWIEERGIQVPPGRRYEPAWQPPEGAGDELDLLAAGVTSVVWAIGFRPDYRWLKVPVFDGRGEPVHHRGVTGVGGVCFLGLPWLHTWGSGRFSGVGRDARHLAAILAARSAAAGAPPGRRAPVPRAG